MDNFILPLLFGVQQAAEGQQPGAGSFLQSIIPFVLIIGIFYMLIIRPQSKKRKETEKMLSAIKKGDKVITIGGLHGTVQSVRETTVIIKADDNVKLEFLRSAVSTVVTAAKEDKSEDKGEEGQSSQDEA